MESWITLTQVAVKVNNVMVALVSSTIAESGSTTNDPPDYKSKVTNMIEALTAVNDGVDAVTRLVSFDSAKCSSQ